MNGDIDAAWAEVEKALPPGYSFGVTMTVGVNGGPFVATTSYGPVERGYAYGDTPAAALRALAAGLREFASEDFPAGDYTNFRAWSS